MRRSADVVAPILASAALGLLAGCHDHETSCVSNDTHKAASMALCRDGLGTPLTTNSYHLETKRGGFGENLAAILLGSAAAAFILGTGG